MHGAPALPPTSPHMPYANPDAPKGGRLVWGLLGTFDSLNPLIVRGIAVQQIRGYVVESLMARGNDEAFTLYGLLAKSVETDDAQKLRHLPSRPHGALLRRQAGHGRRRVCFPGSCCATRAAPTIGSIIPRSQRPRRPTRSRCGSIFGGANDRELPLILGLMPVLAAARGRSRDVRGNHDDRADRLRPLPRQRGQAGAERRR